MPLSLTLLRHAQTHPATLQQQDADRALTDKGLSDAGNAGQWLYQQHLALPKQASPSVIFDEIYCSTATRTRQTLTELMGYAAPHERDRIDYRSELYHAPADRLLRIIHSTSPDVSRLLIVGHNPGIAQLASALAQHANTQQRQCIDHQFLPCTMVCYQFNCATWQEITTANAQLIALWQPE